MCVTTRTWKSSHPVSVQGSNADDDGANSALLQPIVQRRNAERRQYRVHRDPWRSTTTLAINMSQRCLPLSFSVKGDTLAYGVRADANIAPPCILHAVHRERRGCSLYGIVRETLT